MEFSKELRNIIQASFFNPLSISSIFRDEEQWLQITKNYYKSCEQTMSQKHKTTIVEHLEQSSLMQEIDMTIMTMSN